MGLTKKIEEIEAKKNLAVDQSPEFDLQSRHHYDDDNVELDAIERLKSNILMLDDLQKRLAFINDELASVIGTRKK